jgi:hypothetical protein
MKCLHDFSVTEWTFKWNVETEDPKMLRYSFFSDCYLSETHNTLKSLLLQTVVEKIGSL